MIDLPNNIWLDYLRSDLPNLIIETGTHLGWGSALFSKNFKRVITIELSKELSEQASKNNKEFKNIEYLIGTSYEVLKSLIDSINEDYILFLDAHGSGGDTVYDQDIGRYGSPVLYELEAVEKNLPKIIVIDDLSDFDNIPSYPNVSLIKDKLISMGYKKIEILEGQKGWLIAR